MLYHWTLFSKNYNSYLTDFDIWAADKHHSSWQRLDPNVVSNGGIEKHSESTQSERMSLYSSVKTMCFETSTSEQNKK